MIGKLSGIIDSFESNYVLLNVGGVCYLVFASARTLGRIGQAGDPAMLLIDTHVREDHIHLYGFADKAEQQWFRLLTSVQGVGAKVGLSILSTCPPEQLSLAIAAQDKAIITQADGVGPKLAVRILTELKDKAGKLDTSGTMHVIGLKQDAVQGVDHDAVSALVNLGYARGDAFTAVARAKSKTNDNNLQSLIKASLKELVG